MLLHLLKVLGRKAMNVTCPPADAADKARSWGWDLVGPFPQSTQSPNHPADLETSARSWPCATIHFSAKHCYQAPDSCELKLGTNLQSPWAHSAHANELLPAAHVIKNQVPQQPGKRHRGFALLALYPTKPGQATLCPRSHISRSREPAAVTMPDPSCHELSPNPASNLPRPPFSQKE